MYIYIDIYIYIWREPLIGDIYIGRSVFTQMSSCYYWKRTMRFVIGALQNGQVSICAAHC